MRALNEKVGKEGKSDEGLSGKDGKCEKKNRNTGIQRKV